MLNKQRANEEVVQSLKLEPALKGEETQTMHIATQSDATQIKEIRRKLDARDRRQA